MSAPSPANPYSGQYNLQQARAMQALGCEVEIFMPSMWLPRVLASVHPGVRRLMSVPREWEQAGVRMHRTTGLMLHPNVLRYRLWPAAPGATATSVAWSQRSRLEQGVRAFRPDAILAHEGSLLGTLAGTIARRLGVAWGIIEHDRVDFPVNSRCAAWYRKTMKDAQCVFGVAPPSVEHLRAIGLDNVFLAPDGVQAATDAQRATPRPPELAGKTIVLTSGSPVPEKGIAELVRAFAEVAPNATDAMLVVVGPVTPEVEGLLSNSRLSTQITRLERMSHERFQQWMVWADVFALPSHRESFGMVFAEALAAETPVIVTDACGIAPMLKHNEHGWIVPVKDHAALVSALKAALFTADRASMGHAGQRLIEGRFTWEQSALGVLKPLGLMAARM